MMEPKCFRGHGLVLRVGEVVASGPRWSRFNPSSLRMFSYSQVQGGRKQHSETANLKLFINAFRNEYPGQITGLNKQSMGGWEAHQMPLTCKQQIPIATTT